MGKARHQSIPGCQAQVTGYQLRLLGQLCELFVPGFVAESQAGWELTLTLLLGPNPYPLPLVCSSLSLIRECS